MIQVLLDTSLSGEQCEAAETIKHSAESLLTIINDILDFSKIEAGKIELAPAPFNVSETVKRVLRLLRPRAKSACLELREILPDDDLTVIGDPMRLQQVLLNLVGNAIKFTEKGSVTVTARKLDDAPGVPDGKCIWQFTVHDTGIGIPLEKQAAIFEPFMQVDGSTARRFGGTGLGLTISARLVQAMDGKIWLESKPHAGTGFHFTATFDVAARYEAASTRAHSRGEAVSADSEPLKPLNILVVEDNEVNRRVLVAILTKKGHHISVATNGEAGFNMVQRERFDVVLMDVQMPVMDGWETTKAIRLLEHEIGGHVAIIAMTAHAYQEDVVRCREAGMDGYIAKPFQIEDLDRELARVISCLDGEPAMALSANPAIA